MNTRLLQTFQKIVKSFKTQWCVAVVLLLAMTSMQTQAQCIGPYQTFESFSTVPGSWTLNSFTSTSSASSRTGAKLLQSNASGNSIVSPIFTNTKTVSFYINKSAGAGVQLVIDLQFSSDGGTNWFSIPQGTNTVNGENITATIPILPTTAGLGTWSLVTATFNTNHQLDATPTNSSFKFRIRDARASGSGVLWVDDFSIITYNTSPDDNAIVVPTLNQTSACTVTVPSSGYMNFYDQGGLNDNYNKSQTQYMYFQPANATDKVRITFQNTFALDAASNITVYNGNGTGGTTLLNAYTGSTLPGTTVYTSSSVDGYISIKFVSSTTAPNAGFDIKVECIGNLGISSLGTTSGCQGSQLVINGAGFTGTTAANVTIGGTAVSSIVSNTGTVLTVIPAAGSSGTVSVTNGSTVASGTYTVNPLPTVTAGASVCVGSTITLSPTTGGTWTSSDATKATVTNAGVVTGVAAGSATFTFTNTTTGCSATTSSVSVNALPVVSAGASVCVGTTMTLSPTTGGTWSSSDTTKATVTNAGVVTSVAAGSVTFTFTNTTTNCSATTSSVSVNAAPTITSVAMSGQSACTSGSLTALSISATAGSGTISTYQWYSNTTASTSGGTVLSGANAASYTPLSTTPGTLYYYCVVTNSVTCSATSAVSGAIVVSNAATAPTATAATPIGGTSFTANWGAVSGATGYYLDVSTSNTFATFVTGYNNLSVGNVITYAVSGLTQNVTYYYRVRAFNACSTSSNSNQITVLTTALSYCVPTYATGSASGNHISNVTLGTLNNTSGASTTPYYTFYNTVTIPNLYQGNNSTIAVTFGTDLRQYVGVWIDYNQNGTFETTEGVVSVNSAGSGGTATLTLPVPVGALLGNTRMRVRGGDDAALLTSQACGATNSGIGETEDYIVNIIAVPPCTVSIPTSLFSSFVTDTTATLSWSDSSFAPSSVYNYYISTSATPPTGATTPTGTVTGATSVNLTGLIVDTRYYCWVRTNCGSTSSWSVSTNFTTFALDVVVLSGATTGETKTTCNGKFYDSGNATGTYANDESYTYTFVPATPGAKLKAIFNSFALENNFDFLSIYSGTTVNAANLIGTFTGTQIAAGTAFYSTAAGGELTFKFTSDFSVLFSGWDVSLSCVLVPSITRFSPTTACAGSTVPVTITGTNFTGATTVSFNGTNVTPTSVTATQIVVNVPVAATTGYISVSSPTATGISTSMFTVKPLPNIPNAGTDTSVCVGSSVTLNAIGSIGSQVIVQDNCNSISNWTTNDSSRWNTVTSNIAGGTAAGELRFFWFAHGGDGAYIKLNQLINTVGYTGLNLSFNHMLDDFTGNSNNYSLYLETSPNGTTWTTRWSTTTSTDISATGVNVNLSALNGTSFYIRFRFEGDAFDLDNWYIDDVILTGNPTLSYTWSTSSTLTPVIASTQSTSVTPASTQTYYVATTLNGCNSVADDVIVTVKAKPTGVVSGTTSVCSGNTATVSIALTGTAPWSLTYTNGTTPTTVTGILTSPYTFTTPAITATTTYTVTALNDATCSAVSAGITGSAVISLSTPPTITIASAAALVCYSNSAQNTTLTYSASSGGLSTYTVVWNTAPFSGTVTALNTTFPASGPITIPVPAGADNSVLNYATITVKNASGCVSAGYQFSIPITTSPAVTMSINSQTACYDATNSQTVTYSYSNANILNSYDVTWNALPANSLPTITNAPFSTTSGSISITVPAGTAGGTYTGTVTPKNSACGNGATPRTITLIISAPSITPSASPAQVCYSASNQTANLTYSGATATPTTYSVVWNAVPSNTFANVTNAAITATPIVLSIPAGTAVNTYTGTITVKNANGCTGPATSFSVNINGNPSMTASSAVTAVCTSSSLQTSGLNYTATTNNPTSYSIDWNAAANTALLSDQSTTTFAFGVGSGTINSIVIPANIVAGTYTGTITITNAATCTSSYPITIGIGKKWTGTVSSDWSNASNWTPSGEPTVSDCVVIPSTSNNPIIASNASCGSLTINSGVTLTVNTGITLTVQDFVKTDGTLTVNTSGSLVQVNNVPNSGTGSMVYKRDVSGLRGYDYIYWSSPVASQNIATIYSTPTPGSKYYWDVLTNNGNGTGGNISQGNWAAASGAMQVGKGYIVRASNNYSWTGSLTSTFTGIPNNGTLTYALNRGSYTNAVPYTGVNGSLIGQWDDNYNLIGNPYPSAIDASKFLNDAANSSKIQGFIYLWTHGLTPSASVSNPFYGSFSANYSLSDYLTYNNLGSSTPTGFNGKIASGQGFYVALNDGATVTDSSQPITFNNLMRDASYGNSQFYKNANSTATANDTELHRIWIDLIDANQSSTSILVGYASNASNGLDRMYDAVTGIDGNVMYSVIDDQSYSIQGRAVPFDAEDQVSLGYHAAVAGNFTIAINTVDGLFQQGQPIYLEDKLLNVIYDLRQAPYNFSTPEGIYNNRFVLRYTNNALNTYQIGTANVAISVSNNQLMVKANKEIEAIQVFDLTGKLVKIYNSANKTTDFKDDFVFEKGVYLAKIRLTDGTLVNQKIMN